MNTFSLQIDEEGVVRVLDHDPETLMEFTTGDFGRFLTEFLQEVIRLSAETEGDDEDEN